MAAVLKEVPYFPEVVATVADLERVRAARRKSRLPENLLTEHPSYCGRPFHSPSNQLRMCALRPDHRGCCDGPEVVETGRLLVPLWAPWGRGL